MDKQYILDMILNEIPDTRLVGDNRINMRCFLCGDSEKNPNKKRLYLKIDPHDPQEPILYNCFNCNEKGVMTVDMFKEMGITDSDALSFISRLNHHAFNDDGSRANKYRNKKEIQLEIPEIKSDQNTINKIKYLYSRIKYKFTKEDVDKLKIVFSIKDLLNKNEIKSKNEYLNMIDRDYVGFLSVNNEYLILRDITNRNKMRYIKYNLFDMYSNTSAFYSVKASLDLLSTDRIDINIAEGPMDVLGIIYNIFNGEIHNQLFLASCNGAFTNPLMYAIKKGFVGDNIHINCWQDNDTLINFKRLSKKFKVFTPNFKVYYNTISKDFGVPKDQIEVDEILLR